MRVLRWWRWSSSWWCLNNDGFGANHSFTVDDSGPGRWLMYYGFLTPQLFQKGICNVSFTLCFLHLLSIFASLLILLDVPMHPHNACPHPHSVRLCTSLPGVICSLPFYFFHELLLFLALRIAHVLKGFFHNPREFVHCHFHVCVGSRSSVRLVGLQ